jgi:hypothetical protein
MTNARIIAIVMFTTSGIAAADPDPTPVTVPTFTLQTSMFDAKTPPAPVPSLRVEAARVAQEKYDGQWRYPAPGELGGYDGTGFFWGHGHYRPRTARGHALHAGSVGATLLGEILLGSGSPLAGVGALAAGATLDAAAADSDRDAEAQRPR